MFGRKKKAYANDVVFYMQHIFPIGDQTVIETFKDAFDFQFEACRKANQPAHEVAFILPIHICDKIYHDTTNGSAQDTDALNQWKLWLVTIVDILLYDEPHSTLAREMVGQDYLANFEKLKTLPAYCNYSAAQGRELVETYGDLVIIGRRMKDYVTTSVEKLNEIEKSRNQP